MDFWPKLNDRVSQVDKAMGKNIEDSVSRSGSVILVSQKKPP